MKKKLINCLNGEINYNSLTRSKIFISPFFISIKLYISVSPYNTLMHNILLNLKYGGIKMADEKSSILGGLFDGNNMIVLLFFFLLLVIIFNGSFN